MADGRRTRSGHPWPFLVALGLALLIGCATPERLPDDDDDLAVDDDDVTSDDDDSGVVADDDDTTPEDLDFDDDGLLNAFEKKIGTNPAAADSDADGFDDGVEYLSFFYPWDETDFPYAGGYPRGPIPASVAGEGFDQGQVSSDWSAFDPFDEELYLHRFYGNVVVIYIDTEEAPPIGSVAPLVQQGYEELADQGFVVLNFLTQGLTFGSMPDGDRFVAEHGVTFPVFEHGSQSISSNYHFAPFVPHFSVLDRELRIRAISFSGYNEWADARAFAEALLAEDPPEVDWPLP